jgi:hypothetical protein
MQFSTGNQIKGKIMEIRKGGVTAIVYVAVPGDTLTLNINPSSYWLVNGERPFASYRPMEPDLWAAVFDELLLGAVPQTVPIAAEGRRVG